MKSIFFVAMLSIMLLMSGCSNKVSSKKPSVIMEDKGNYYKVEINLDKSTTHKQIGVEYGEQILKFVPEYQKLYDSYIQELAMSNEILYRVFLSRVEDIKGQIRGEYKEEIDGLSISLANAKENVMGDGRLSKDELYLLNLIPDVVRATQCSAFSVYGDKSSTGRNITARLLDWYGGNKNQINKVQAVTVFNIGKKSFCSVGYLGFLGVITGFNNNKVFGAILDSPTLQPYDSQGRRSYTLDLRYALENYDTLEKVADYMKSPANLYAFSHLIYLSDENKSGILENNTTSEMRALRLESSQLNKGVQWNTRNSIAAVNAFMIKGNLDNYSPALVNKERWNSLRLRFNDNKGPLSVEDIKKIASFKKGYKPGKQEDGDIYNKETKQIVIFEPSSLSLQVFFRPKEGELPLVPIFEKIDIKFHDQLL